MTFVDQKPMQTRTEVTWTDDRVELLKRLRAEGLSTSQIAGELGGITRNAVIGKVHRLGLSGRAGGGPTTLANATISGDFQQSLAAEIRIRREDGAPIALSLPIELVARQTSRWLSACPADVRPGDVIAPDGTKANFRALRGAK